MGLAPGAHALRPAAPRSTPPPTTHSNPQSQLLESLNATKQSLEASWPGWDDVLPAGSKKAKLAEAALTAESKKDELEGER